MVAFWGLPMLSRRSAHRGVASLLAIALTANALPLWAQEEDGLTDEQREEAIVYARDNATYTLYHEVGHLFVDQFELPMLAKEEDAADNLATLMILDAYDASEDGAILYNAFWYWSLTDAEQAGQEIDQASLFDEHSLDKQRAFAMVCLVVGKDKDEFADIAQEWELDADQQEACGGTYEQAKTGWDKVLDPHRTPNEGDPKISVVYDEPGAGSEWAAEILQSGEVLEDVARTVEASYTLPNDVVFRAADCGQANAFYSSWDATVTMCYEFVAYYYDQYVASLAEQADDEEAKTEDDPEASEDEQESGGEEG
jgi:hypothetical protein